MESIKSSIDNRQSIINKVNSIDRKSIIDIDTVNKIQKMIGDSKLEEPYIRHAIKKLGLGKVINIAEYVTANAYHPGKAFIGLCQKEIGKKANA